MSSFINSILNLFRGNALPQQLQEIGIRTTQDAASLHFQNRAGQQIALNDASVIIQDTNGNIITLDAAGSHIQSAAKLNIDRAQLTVSTGQVTIDSGMVKVSGVVQCDTIIANSVIGSSYTPGVGNIS